MAIAPPKAIVTGASRGFGFALAAALGGLGWTVFIAAPDQSEADVASRRLAAQVPLGRFVALACDVRDAAQVDRLADLAATDGAIDLWINNAGLALTGQTLKQLAPADFARMIDVNLRGVFHGCRSAARIMAGRGGLIVNIHGAGSDGKPVPGMIGYATTKRAVQFFTKALAAELAGTPLSVIGISPGLVLTEGFYREHAKTAPEALAAREAVVNILADDPVTVAEWAVKMMLGSPRNGREYRWLTPAKIKRRAALRPPRDVLSANRLGGDPDA